MRTLSAALAGTLMAAGLLGATVAPAHADAVGVTVAVPAASETGVSTGIVLAQGDSVTVTASGLAQTSSHRLPTDPDGIDTSGLSNSCVGIVEVCLDQQATASSLVAKTGSGEWKFIGKGPTTLTGVGLLSLAFNDAHGFFGDNVGEWTATLDVTRSAPTCSTSTVGQPINADGTSSFKQGSTVPVKVRCATGTLSPSLGVQKVSASAVGTTLETQSTAAATSGSLFRYDAAAGHYIFNLSTKSLTVGTYALRIDLGNGSTLSARLSLR